MFYFCNVPLIYHLCVTSFFSLHNVCMQPLVVTMSITERGTWKMKHQKNKNSPLPLWASVVV